MQDFLKRIAPHGAAVLALLSTVAAAVSPGTSRADALVEPPVFRSHEGVLDIMMVATPKPAPTIAYMPPGGGPAIHPQAWVFEVCARPATGLSCPAGSDTVSPYGGVRLALKPGDTLKVRFVNRLPKVDPSKLRHVNDPGEANLYLNPSNLHTHGLLTPARPATLGDPTFGDFVYLTVFNSANGLPAPQSTHQHGPILMDKVDYKITIPANHPSGLFWFHPHVHGIALNQVVQGMSGLITVGEVGDYVRDAGLSPWPDTQVRHLMLKEMQVLAAGTVNFDSGPQPVASGEVLNQEDTSFCAQQPASGELRLGACPGQDNSAGGGSNFTGGKWFMTVNGQQFPSIPVSPTKGEVWRLATGAGSFSWNLQLVDDKAQKPMTVQLLAIDGVAVNLPQNTPPSAVANLGGAGRFRVAPCRNSQVIGTTVPVCVDQIVMMPSSRVELWVTYRDDQGQVARPPSGASATLKMTGLTMGTGDAWPAVDLAKVLFNAGGADATRSTTLTDAVVVGGSTDAAGLDAVGGIHAAVVPGALPTALPQGCAPLPLGHRRRVFFGFSDVTVNNTFAMGYEEVDAQGRVVPGSQKPAPDQLERFDPAHTTVCLPLGPGQTPVSETWELIQLSTENHNFHMHQVRFAPADSKGRVRQDNILLGVTTPDPSIADQVMNNQNGVCTATQWRQGLCVSKPVVLEIPFSQLGEFVYHCHILEHEDGGMMARIRVVPSPY